MDNRTVKEASVEGIQRRRTPKKHFVFCVKVTWSDGTVNLVYRRYSEFLHLQILSPGTALQLRKPIYNSVNKIYKYTTRHPTLHVELNSTILCQAFPDLLGKPRSNRKNFSQLPDSCKNIGETLFNRMEQLNLFLKDIFGFEKVTQSKHIRSFLRPKGEDLESQDHLPRRKKKKGTRNGNFSKTMKKRLTFKKSGRIACNHISSPIIFDHFIVMDDYKKQAKSDINLKKGKTVDVIEKRESGWWLVDADGEVGWAPALYLEPADEMSDTEVSNVQRFPISKGEVYVTTKRYVAVEDDELTFDIGVNLQILEKNFDGWWKASYLGREGWVPQMYLKKLGEERYKTRASRKSVVKKCSALEIRTSIEEEEEMIIEVTHAEADDKTHKEDNKPSKEVDDKTDSGQTKPGSKDKAKTVGVMFDLSSMFLPLEIPNEGSSNEIPTPKTPQASTDRKLHQRPSLQRRAVSDGIALVLGKSLENQEEKKDDTNLKTSGLESNHSSKAIIINSDGASISAMESKWKPDPATTTSLPRLGKGSKGAEASAHPRTPEAQNSNRQDLSTSAPNTERPNMYQLTTSEGAAVSSDFTSNGEKYDKKLVRQASVEEVVHAQELPSWSSSDESDLKLQDLNEYSTDVYSCAETHEVSKDMFLAKGENVKVIERGPNGLWLVENGRGTRGWTSSAKLYPVTEGNGNLETLMTMSGRKDSGKKEDNNNDEVREKQQEETKLSISQMMYRATNNFKGAEDNEEINLHKGEILHIVHKDESGWWCAKNSEGEIGWVPSNFLKLMQGEADNDDDDDEEEEEEDDDDDDDDDDDEEDEDDEEEHRGNESDLHISCRVKSDFKGNEDKQEINLQKGQLVQILHKEENGWWCVRNENGDIGWAPQIHLEALEGDSTDI